MTGKKFVILLLLLTLVLAVAVGCGNGGADSPDPNDNEEPNDEPVLSAQELVEQRCSTCHNLDRVLRERNEDQWPGIVTTMVNKSPGLLDDEEYDLVVEFLQENYSR
jgi:mono/diheme cytochrome c family protein